MNSARFRCPRLSALPVLALSFCLASCGGSDAQAPVEPGGMRVFAVGFKQMPEHVETYQGFRDKMFDLMERVDLGRAPDRMNLVCFPEDTALAAVLIGSRGSVARGRTDVLSGILSLAVPYLPQLLHYLSLHGDISIQRALLLALTDTIWRAFYETFSDLARTYGVWVEACTVVAPTRVSFLPEEIRMFGDPDLEDPGYVYLPEGKDVFNTAFLFDPQGQIVHRTNKVNLVTLEGPALLDLTPGSLDDVEPFDSPGGRLGVAICFDAFHEEYLERMDRFGCTVVIQPSANPAPWAAPSETWDWQPEEWLGSALRAVTDPAYPRIRYVVNPMLTGNLFDIPFDGQSSITARHPPPGTPTANYVGLDPVPGFLALSPWVVQDPVLANPGLTLAERRALLNDTARALAPGSGSEEENAYLETILGADLPGAAPGSR